MHNATKYCIWIVTPDGYSHSHAFDEISLSIHYGLRKLGKQSFVTRRREKRTGRTIVLGPHLLHRIPDTFLTLDTILYNLEQIYEENYMFTNNYFDILRRFEVWDYSDRNIHALKSFGVDNVKKCSIGYVEELTKVPEAEEDIDVLIYGSMSQRRTSIINELNRMGYNCHASFNVYGKDRDLLISRSKIVLNIHHYPTKIFEIVRVSYLLSNRKFVISEVSQEDEALAMVKDGIVLSEYSDIVTKCIYYLGKDDERKRIADVGFNIFKNQKQEEFLRQIV